MTNIKTNENILTLRQNLSVYFPLSNKVNQPTHDHQVRLQVLLMDLANLGFKLDKKLLAVIKKYDAIQLKQVYDFLINELQVVKGDHVDYIPLFLNFPHQIPNDIDYLLKRYIGFFSNIFLDLDENEEGSTKLSCGHVVDSQLFDVKSFGACPICQQQTKEQSVTKNDSVTNVLLEEKIIYQQVSCMNEDSQNEYIQKMIYFPRPLSVKQKEHLTHYIKQVSPQIFSNRFSHDTIKIKENLAFFIFNIFENYKNIKSVTDLPQNLVKSLNSVTDVLRVTALFSGGDVALTQKNKFKLSNRQRSFVVSCLDLVFNAAPNSELLMSKFEDGLKYRSYWVRLFKYLHVGSYQHKNPKTFNFSQFVQDGYKTHKTLSQKVHYHLVNKNSLGVVDLLKNRKGLLLRNLDVILRNLSEGEASSVLSDTLIKSNSLSKVPTSMLTKLFSHFLNRSSANDKTIRYFIPKGEDSKIYVLDKDSRSPISETVTNQLFEALVEELSQRFQKAPQFKSTDKVYIDPKLNSILLPLNIQSSSKEVSTLQKGSKIKLNIKKEVLRLFVYWKQSSEDQRVDVDLSVVAFDSNLNVSKEISFRRYSDEDDTIVHSGDIQSAPQGASEFIDIRHQELLDSGVRYVGVLINSFTGQTFDQFQCFAGLMERKNQQSGELFEPATVTHKYDLANQSTSNIPFVLDLKTGELIWTDIGGSKKRGDTISSNRNKITRLVQATQVMNKNNMSMRTLIDLHVRSSGASTEVDPNKANVKIKLEDCLNPVTFLDKFLK